MRRAAALAWMLLGASPDVLTVVVCGDHFEDPPAGMVEGIVAAKPAAVVSTGDLVFRSRRSDFDRLKRVFLDPLARAGADFYPCLGNHDFPIDGWPALWGPERGKSYYSFDLRDAHFVVLDGNLAQAPLDKTFEEGSEERHIQRQGKDFRKGSEQHAWLIRDLEKTDKRFLFAFIHHPLLSFGGHFGEPALQRELGPVFEKYRFSAVFTGHSHGYERFKPVRFDLRGERPVGVLDEAGGVTYVVTASGSSKGNLYDIKADPLHASFKKAANYVVLRIDQDEARGEAWEPGGKEPIDTFRLKPRR